MVGIRHPTTLCHSERSEESLRGGVVLGVVIFRFAQNDKGELAHQALTLYSF